MTAILHIEHPVGDFDEWKRVFDGFHDFRVEHGVRSLRVGRRIDDESQVTIDLLFDNTEAADTFHGALKERVWSRQRASDLLTGAPSAVVVALVEDTTSTAGQRAARPLPSRIKEPEPLTAGGPTTGAS